MLSLIDAYFDAIQSVIGEIRARERERIDEAARLCADCIASGGVVHIHDTGHMLNTELIHRAGGLAALTPFSFSLNVNNPNPFRETQQQPPEPVAAVIALALQKSNIRSGDVLVIGSVSGKSERVVELAIQARALGVMVIGVTSVEYSSALESQHPSGKRLFEAVDLVIDNCAPYGDAMLEVEGVDAKVCPASGVSAACIMWAVCAGVVEALVERGITPTVYRSVNLPGGPEDVQARQNRYRETGF